jgi:hypothetical protein
MTIDIRIVDENDKAHEIKGTVVAGTPLHLWHNIRVPVCLARWEYEGKVERGDVQDVQYSDFVLLIASFQTQPPMQIDLES